MTRRFTRKISGRVTTNPISNPQHQETESMNYTKSGIIAVGAPNSLARMANEARLSQKETPSLLLLTEEGNDLADRFFKSIGCDPNGMDPETRAEVLNRQDLHLHTFLCGFIHCAELSRL